MITHIISFWNWFSRFSEVYKLVHRLPPADNIFWKDQLITRLRLYCNYGGQIHFRMGPDESYAELIFTTKRQSHYVDIIDQLIQQAPAIPGWKFQAMYPPRHPRHNIVERFGPTYIEPEELWISPAAISSLAGGRFFVNIYAELYDPADIIDRQIVEAMLFNILGERSFVMDLAGFKVTWLYSLNQELRYKCAPLYKLPVLLARMKDPDYAGGEHRKSA